MEKRSTSTTIRIMSEIGLMAAAGFILDVLAKMISRGLFPSGGSISIAMIAIMIIAFRRGFFPALGVGFILAIFDLLQGPFLIASTPIRILFQVMLDYAIPYPLVALTALLRPAFKKANSKKVAIRFLILGALIGASAKFASHFCAGILFWADPSTFAWGLIGMNPYAYCFLYNFAYMGPSMVLCIVLLCLIYLRAPRLFGTDQKEVGGNQKANRKGLILSATSLLFGLFMFTISLVSYINSYVRDDYGASGAQIGFDKAYLLLWFVGAFLILFSLASFMNALKNYKATFFPAGISIVSGISALMSLGFVLSDYVKGRSDWRIASLLIASIAVLTAGLYAFLTTRPSRNSVREIKR